MATKWETSIRQVLHRIANKWSDQAASDRDLLCRFLRHRDQQAFALLVRRHNQLVLGVAQRVLRHYQEAEDVCQATFLLLARKANKVPWRESVANWLYTVAYKLALEARDAAKRRATRESQAVPRPTVDTMAEITSRDFQAVLDEELIRLPKKYSAAIVLCCLEGRTRDEAARYLGLTLESVKSCLEEGRELLRCRLVRRGITFSTALASLPFTASPSHAALSAAAIRSTAEAAVEVIARQTWAGVLAAKVIGLIHLGAQAVLPAKLKVAAMSAAAIGIIATAILALPQIWPVNADAGKLQQASMRIAGEVRQNPLTTKSQQSIAEGETAKITIQGKVLGINGKAAPGARLWLVGVGDKPVDLGFSTADGGFKVLVPPATEDTSSYLVAQVENAGIDFFLIPNLAPDDAVELRAVKDNPIKGRVINTEGKPVAGAKVSSFYVNVFANNSMDSFLVQYKKENDMNGLPFGIRGLYLRKSYLLSTETDADGRFTIVGAGLERLVQLRIQGNGIADSELVVVNRPGFDPKPYHDARRANSQWGDLSSRLNGPEISLVAETERLIRGVVTDIDTGKPRAGVEVHLDSYRVSNQVAASATTDAEGRYEIRGARKAKSYWVGVNSDAVAGYVGSRIGVEDQPGYEPIKADIVVKKGVIVTGRIIDSKTKKTVKGFAMVDALSDNPFVKSFPGWNHSIPFQSRDDTADDGSFRVLTIPGTVILMGGPSGRGWSQVGYQFKPPTPDPLYPQYFEKEMPQYYVAYFGPENTLGAVQGCFCKVLQIEPNSKIVTHDIVIEPTTALPVKIEDALGNPVKALWVNGMSPRDGHHPIQIPGDSCSAYHLEGKPRLLVFWEPTKNLMGSLALAGSEKESAVAKLGPPGAVKGRLLGEDGTPLVGVTVDISFQKTTATNLHRHVHRATLVETDADGRYQFENVIPGAEFSLWFTQGKKRFEPCVKMDYRSVQNGAVLDVGAVKLTLKAKDD